MKSYIKIYGPPIRKAIKELEKIAIDMPEVCIMDTFISTQLPNFEKTKSIIDYLSEIWEIPVERCEKMISDSGESLGEHDFFFEWFTEPTIDQYNSLLERIDNALAPLGCEYTITTKGTLRKPDERLIILRKSEIDEAMKGIVSFDSVSSEELITIRNLFMDLIDLKCEAKGASLTKNIKDQIINLFLLIVKKTGDSL